MKVRQAAAVLVCLVTAVTAGVRAQGLTWLPPACDLKPGHYLVNSGVLYLKSAATTKFEEQRAKDLKDANRVLMQALGNGQDKNPAAWYYLGRYYLITGDLAGADTALGKAQALAPKCKDDIDTYRRQAWVPVFNAGVQAWQAGKTDSAIAYFGRANAVYRAEPMGFVYLANLFVGANQTDSAAKYFRLAVDAASDPKYAKDRRDALFNVARVYHAAQRYDEAAAAYRDYLAAYPNDVQAMASLASLEQRAGRSDSALALYTRISEHADSADASDLFSAAQAVLNGLPTLPDTSTMMSQCRAAQRKKTPALTARQIAARCTPAAADTLRKYHAVVDPAYRLASKMYEAGLAKNPNYRDALYNLAGISYVIGDTGKVLPLARRLFTVDPMNRNTLAKLAGGWQLGGNKDSVLYYLQLADSLPIEVTVSTFTPGEKGATLDGLITNLKAKRNAPVTLTFEFLDAQGNVVSQQQQQVPALDASANQQFTVKGDGAGIVAWRYRRS